MEIQTSISWSKTLKQFAVGDIHQFKINAKQTSTARMSATRVKEKTGMTFTTKTLSDGIEIKRIK